MNKNECYVELFKLKQSGIDVSSQLVELAQSDKVPASIIEFLKVSSPDKRFYESLRVKSNKNNNKLYKNLLDESDKDIIDKSVLLASYITQCILFSKSSNMNSVDRDRFYESVNYNKVLESLIHSESIDDTLSMIRSSLKSLK